MGLKVNHPPFMPGHTVQVVNFQTGAVATGITIMPFDDTIPQISEGDEFMTLAITPKATTNKLKIEVVAYFSNSLGNRPITAALFQGANASALAGSHRQSDYPPYHLAFTHYMIAGTTSAITFKVRAGNSGGGTLTFNGDAGARKLGGVLASSITITEFKA